MGPTHGCLSTRHLCPCWLCKDRSRVAVSYDKLAAELDVKPCQMLGNHCTIKQTGIPDWGHQCTPSHPKTPVRDNSMRLMSSDLRDPIATNQAPREAPQRGTGEKACGPWGPSHAVCSLSSICCRQSCHFGCPKHLRPQHLCPPLPCQDPAPTSHDPHGPSLQWVLWRLRQK